MSELSFVPLDRANIIADGTSDFTTLFADQGGMENASTFLLLRHEFWSDCLLGYSLARDDLKKLEWAMSERNLEVEQRTRELPFEHCSMQGYTAASPVPMGV